MRSNTGEPVCRWGTSPHSGSPCSWTWGQHTGHVFSWDFMWDAKYGRLMPGHLSGPNPCPGSIWKFFKVTVISRIGSATNLKSQRDKGAINTPAILQRRNARNDIVPKNEMGDRISRCKSIRSTNAWVCFKSWSTNGFEECCKLWAKLGPIFTVTMVTSHKSTSRER